MGSRGTGNWGRGYYIQGFRWENMKKRLHWVMYEYPTHVGAKQTYTFISKKKYVAKVKFKTYN
jgi:hypothetical protein